MAAANQALTDEEYEKALLRIEAAEYKREHLREFPPNWYDWQQKGLDSHVRQVLTMAGNQTGKTWSGAYHFACDVTGDYPEDWKGFKFDHAIECLAIGVDSEQLSVIQTNLLGQVIDKKFTGGWIHPDEIKQVNWSRTTKDVAARVHVKSKFGTSIIHFRSYTQVQTGQQSLTFAGRVLDLIWPDEQPPDELMGQLNVRLVNGNRGKGGRMRLTMTPELGVTELIEKFTNDPGKHQMLIGPVSWDECEHMTPEAQEAALDGVPEHEHEMRSKGIPYFGAGLIYPYPESRIVVDAFEIPDHFACIKGVDLGMHPDPTAVAWLVMDRDADVIYLVKDYAESDSSVPNHATAMNSLYPHAPVVFPHDVKRGESNVEYKAGRTIERAYRKAGITRTFMFENEDESIKVEPGILELQQRMQTGRFKVFKDRCPEFMREKRMYHRKNGKPHGRRHVMDAVRYGAIMLPRHGVAVGEVRRRPTVRAGANVRMGNGRRYRSSAF